MFADRVDAGRRLAKALARFAAPDTVVLGIPRGGVIVAAQVARALEAPLGVVLAAKIGHAENPEYAVGALAEDGSIVADPAARMTSREIEALAGPAREKLVRQRQLFASAGEPPVVVGCTALVVDDGLATGLTAAAAARSLAAAGAARTVLAVPVASSFAVEFDRAYYDEVVALHVPEWFGAVGRFYDEFGQTSDAEVVAALGNGDDAPF